jgi:hypothetical protein
MFVFVLINKFIIYEPNYNESTSSAKLPCPFAGSILAVQLPSEPEGAVPSASASRRRRLSSRCFGRRRRIHGDHRGSVPAGPQGSGKARRGGASKQHFRDFVAAEFRAPVVSEADARARLRLAGDYAYLFTSVQHHKVGALRRGFDVECLVRAY